MNIGNLEKVEETKFFKCLIVDNKDYIVGEVTFSKKELDIIMENETAIKALTKTKHIVILEKI